MIIPLFQVLSLFINRNAFVFEPTTAYSSVISTEIPNDDSLVYSVIERTKVYVSSCS